MDCREMGELVDAWVKYFNAKDFQNLMSLYTPDAVQFEAPINRSKTGRDHVRNRYETLAAASGDYRAELSTVCIAQNKAVITLRLSGSNTAPLLGHEPTYKHFDFLTCIILECKDGLIVKHTTFLDLATIFRGLGMTDIPNWYEVPV